jgi:hypothetical protein
VSARPKEASGAAGFQDKDLTRRDQEPTDAKKRRPCSEAATNSRIGDAASSRSTKIVAKKAEGSSDSEDSQSEEESDEEEEEDDTLRSFMSSSKVGNKAGRQTTRN